MTEPLFFDTDCLSAFLWIKNQSLLVLLYPNRIIIPAEVYKELSRPNTPHLKKRIDAMLNVGFAKLGSIDVGSEEYQLYRKMVTNPGPEHILIGNGEASAIAMAKYRNGILASNNTTDINQYIAEFGLKHVTTGDILKEALEKNLITEEEGNQLWQDMLDKNRWLVYPTFTDFLKSHMEDEDKPSGS